MARGSNIDDQRALRWPPMPTGMAAPRPEDNIFQDTPLPPEGAEGGDASDVDPNDIVPTAAAPSSSKLGIGEKDFNLMHPDAWDDAFDDDC